MAACQRLVSQGYRPLEEEGAATFFVLLFGVATIVAMSLALWLGPWVTMR